MVKIKSNVSACSCCDNFSYFDIQNKACRECMRTAIEDTEEKEHVFMECCRECFHADKAKIKNGEPYCEYPGPIDEYIDHEDETCSKKIKYPITNEVFDGDLTPGVYLCLIHGFKDMEEREKAGDWGANGPMIGPLRWTHFIYMLTVRFEFISGFGHKYGLSDHDNELEFFEDCVVFDGMQYGDFTIITIGAKS